MGSLSSLLRQVQEGKATGPVTRAMARWDGKLTEEAVRRVHELELVDITGDRSSGEGRFRGSLLGSCHRMQMMSHLGYIGAPPTDEGLGMMNDGTQRHYWWQKVGLSTGFLTKIESKAAYEPYFFGGQLDGEGEDAYGTYGFELKTTNPVRFKKNRALYEYQDPKEYTRVKKSGSLMTKHAIQVGGYFKARPDLERFSVVYEERSYGTPWFEVVVTRDDVMAITEDMFTKLLGYREREEMPPVKPGYPDDNECRYWCSYVKICPSARF
jgi:hypothetical protein